MELPSGKDVLTFSTKVGAKVASLNAVVPGAGSVVDFGEAIKDFSQGNNFSGAINVASGLFDLVTLGLWGACKEVAQGAGKTAAVDTAKKAAKEATKKAGQEAGKGIAKGASKEAAVATAKAASKEATKKVGRQLGIELSKDMLEEAVEWGAYKATQKTVSELFKKGVVSGTLQSGLIGSEEIFKSITGEILHDSATEFFKQAPKETFKSATAYAAQNAAFGVLKEEAKRAGRRELVKAGTIGCGKWAL